MGPSGQDPARDVTTLDLPPDLEEGVGLVTPHRPLEDPGESLAFVDDLSEPAGADVSVGDPPGIGPHDLPQVMQGLPSLTGDDGPGIAHIGARDRERRDDRRRVVGIGEHVGDDFVFA